MPRFLQLILLATLLALEGCGPAPVSGGANGRLLSGSGGLEDIQVTVHQMEGGSWHPLGFGVTDHEGKFALVQNGAKGPLWLLPGEYRCTLQSAGAPVAIPDVYSQPDTTPLQAVVQSQYDVLELKTQEFSLQR